MGGAYGTNLPPSAEFNIFADGSSPRGVHLWRSISDDGPRSHQQTVCTPDVIARMEGQAALPKLFSDIMNFTLKTQFENYSLAGGGAQRFTCISYLINPDGIKTQEMYVEVGVNSGPCWAHRLRRAGRSWQARQYQSRHHY
ncbi:hypothetical protein OHD60_22025 [Escherichia coli]|nr:hypothetical protein [Escherichia coli]